MIWAWLSLLIRSGVILASAEVLRRASRRLPAEYRHRILAAGFCLLLAWPLLSAVIPAVSVVRLWPHDAHAIVTVSQTARIAASPIASAQHTDWPFWIWVSGFSMALLPLLLGYLRMWRLVKRACPVRDGQWQMLLASECNRLGLKRKPELLVVNAPLVPLTCGLFRAKVLLPSECLEWPLLRRRAVLVHELMHVKRSDLAWQMFASLTSAIWWFQPLCWISRRSLRQESEQACDAWVVASGIRASDYAGELLSIAQRLTAGPATTFAATGMARRNGLEPRLRAILDPENGIRGRFRWLPALILIPCTLAASAMSILPQENEFEGGHLMKRSVITGLLFSAGLTAATIGGSVFDVTGTAIGDAKASIYNPDTGLKQEASTTPDGKFTFQSLPAGSYILHVEKPGFASVYREFNVGTDSEVERALVLNPTKNPLRVGGQVAEANLLTRVQPTYPAAAKEAHVQGTVELDVTISKEGVPEDLRVVRSPSDDLTESALEAVRQWRYRPTLLNGQPIPISTDVIVNYTLMK